MTVRFSIADVAEMLKVSVDRVRFAIEELEKQGDLTAETFAFADRAWRVAPLDIKKIQRVLAEHPESDENKQKRRVVKKVVKSRPEDSAGDE